MEMTLDIVRTTLLNIFDVDSFSAQFITSVQSDKTATTAHINKQGELRYNPEFVNKHIKTPEHLFCLIMHELLHTAFDHFIYNSEDQLVDIGCDMLINATIARLFYAQSNYGILFKDLYSGAPRNDIQHLLYSGNKKMDYTNKYKILHNNVHRSYGGRYKLTTAEVIRDLKLLTTQTIGKVLLLGGHNQANTEGASQNANEGTSQNSSEAQPGQLPQKISSKLAAELLEAIKDTQRAGFSNSLAALFIELLTTKQTMQQKLLSSYTTRKKLDNFFQITTRQQRITTPFPLSPSKKDFVLLSAGYWPGLFRVKATQINKYKVGLALFIDVSGSVNAYLPKLLSLLMPLQNKINMLYLFSNAVVETDFNTLRKGKVETTHGTDFNCIAETIINNDYDKAVIITDGIAEMNEINMKELKARRVKLLTILFNAATTNDQLAQFGPLVNLESIIS